VSASPDSEEVELKFSFTDGDAIAAWLDETFPPMNDAAWRTLEISDQGRGIREEDLAHVFDRFYRAVGARSRPGSGLGLAIVRDIVAGPRGHGLGRQPTRRRSGGGLHPPNGLSPNPFWRHFCR